MHHIHLLECPSTQTYLKDYLDEKYQEVLISCERQTAGVGRYGRSWIQGKDSLAFSFCLKPSTPSSLTSLEIGVLIAQFFSNQNLELKWPNDLMIDKKKCGGILCQNFSDFLLVGVGINLGTIDFSVEGREVSSLPYSPDKKKLPQDIYSYILQNRLAPLQIREEWMKYCCHLDQQLSLENETGVFLGIGSYGQLLLNTPTGIKSFFSGSL